MRTEILNKKWMVQEKKIENHGWFQPYHIQKIEWLLYQNSPKISCNHI